MFRICYILYEIILYCKCIIFVLFNTLKCVAVLLMTVGSMIWILGGSERAVTVGQTTCALSLVPFSLAMVHLVDNMMIAQHQRQLDVYERNGCTLADRCVNEEAPLMRKV